MKLDYTIIMAASRDAGNRSMRSAGRTAWDCEDYNAACAEFERLAPADPYLDRVAWCNEFGA